MELLNKTVLITGAASGLGKAVAMEAAMEGANLVLADINPTALEAVVLDIEQIGGKCMTSVVDVCKQESIYAMLDAAMDTFGTVTSLVNSAGIFSSIPFLELTQTDWDKMLDINLKGSFLCAQAFIKRLLGQKQEGAIVFLSSISGYVGFTKSAHYCASKGAIRQLSKAIALEFGGDGIRSNVVAPGTIETPMNAWIMNDPAMYRQSIASIPLGRFGLSSEIASAICFLLSDKASFCSGAELLVDGGQITHC